MTSNVNTLRWLLDGDASIRWQTMRDLSAAPAEKFSVERSRVANEGWGAMLLGRQRTDGNWGDGTTVPHWKATLFTLLLLRTLGVDPDSEPVRGAIVRVVEHVNWGAEFDRSPFFAGETEPCINGGVVALGAYFGAPDSQLVDRLLSEQLNDGGWNCEAERGSVRSSFHTTICVLEGLLEYERATGDDSALAGARAKGHEYLLERRLFRRLSSGEVIEPKKGGRAMPSWTRFTFPSMWQYDVLRGLDYLRSAGIERDERMSEALTIIDARRQTDGCWLLDQGPRDAFDEDLEAGAGQPSRWMTLRAMRVLNLYKRIAASV